MARGRRAPKRGSVGRAPARAMARGGRTRPAPRGRAMARGSAMARGRGSAMARGGRPAPRRMAGGGGAGQSTCNPRTGVGCGNQMGSSYKRGGRTRPAPRGRTMARGGRAGVRKMPGGGNVGGYNYGNSGCQMWTGQIDCNAKPGCSWNFDDGCCH